MSATIISDPVVVSAPETQPPAASAKLMAEIEFAKCECCGLTEEYTLAYIETVRKRFSGKWICGLCAEAVKDEILRNDKLISTEEALAMHMNFCNKVRSPEPPTDPAVLLISAMKQLLRRSLDSPRIRSTPTSPIRKGEKISGSMLARSGSCFSSLSS